MKTSTYQDLAELKEIWGADVILMRVPENVHKRGNPEAGLANIEVLTSLSLDALEYVIVALATELVRKETARDGNNPF
jgi:hypothetical protein